MALYNYNPHQSCTTGRPELELTFKKGDILTVIGDMDPHGYYKAEMNGERNFEMSTNKIVPKYHIYVM